MSQPLSFNADSVTLRATASDTAATTLEGGTTLSNDLLSQGYATHGVISGPSNNAMGVAQEARNAAAAALYTAVSNQGPNLRAAVTAYNDADKGAANNVGQQMQNP